MNPPLVFAQETVLQADNISWFAISGMKRPEGGWPVGRYRAAYTLERSGKTVATIRRDIVAE